MKLIIFLLVSKTKKLKTKIKKYISTNINISINN